MMLYSTIEYFPTALLLASVWATAFGRTLHVDSSSNSEIADGTHSHPFSSLDSAWKFIATNPADTTEIRLAGGIYILPNSQHIFKDVIVNHSPENATQNVILRQSDDSATTEEPPLYARGTAKIKFQSLSFEGLKMNVPSSSSKWALMHSGDSSSIELHECEIKGFGPESFVRFMASDSSTLTINSTLVQDTAFQITTLDNSTLVNSNLIVKNSTVKDRAIFDSSGNSTISFQNSTFNSMIQFYYGAFQLVALY
ncbi:hypothetical protein BKA69DRAFT_450782 [Paraphysoderma sedebokerense]|nr:hypothetical protein BKA69DRAFT_450782 [Paraphysoderma sedebokerense]